MWLAVDVGGSKLAAAAVTPAGELTAGSRGTAAGTTDPDELFDRLLAVIDRVTRGEPVEAIGVGCGGPMTWPAGEVSPLNIPAWRNFPLRARLAERWPGAPVRLINDAIAFAAGEHWRGAGRGSAALLGVVVSTGVGGGLVMTDAGGRPAIVPGPTGNAGHVGHVVVDPDGPECGCGGWGCLEAVARGPAVVAWAVSQGWQPPRGRQGPPDGVQLVESAGAGDPIALAALTRAGRALGLVLASAAHLFDLDRIVVGGGFATGAGDLLLGPALAAFRRHAVMPFAGRCRVVPAKFGHDAGLVGAAALVASDRYWPAGAD